METARQSALRRLTLVLDAFLLVLTLPLAVVIHRELRHVAPFLREPPSTDQMLVLPIVLVPLFVGTIAVLGLHRVQERTWSSGQLLAGIFKLHLVGFLGLTVLVFLTQTVINRSLAAVYLSCTFLALAASRALLLRWVRFQHSIGEGRARLLLVGEDSEELTQFLSTARAAPLPPDLVGVLRSSEAPKALALKALGTPSDLEPVLHSEAIDQVLFFPPYHRPADVLHALEVCETLGVPASFALEMPRLSLTAPRVIFESDRPFLSFELAPKRPEHIAIKHGLDVVLGAVFVVLFAPVMAAAALAILVTMGRPIFFTQDRAGRFGRTFRMRKFRTMRPDAEQLRDSLSSRNEMSGPVFKIANDERITPLGRFLRRTSIDELPQLFHVVSGVMSLVGPRPLPIKEQAAIRGLQRRRLSMKPGITGLWQVSGRSDIDFPTWMKMDLEYVDRWSLSLDFRILMKTFSAVLLGRGAR